MLEQLPAWLADYSAVEPHFVLGYQSRKGYQATPPVGRSLVLPKAPPDTEYRAVGANGEGGGGVSQTA